MTEWVHAIDASLDQGYGRRDLMIPEVASLVQQALLRFDGERYSVIAWCVMPNHVHTLIEMHIRHPLSHIVHAWKSFTAKQANRYLERSGAFWAPEYFDRYMRDDAHFGGNEVYSGRTPSTPGSVRKHRTGTFRLLGGSRAGCPRFQGYCFPSSTGVSPALR